VRYVRERQKPQRPLPRYAQGHLLRRKADFKGAAEDGEGRPIRQAARSDKPARGKTCDAIQGLLDEGQEIMDEYKGCEALDAGMLAAAQAVEHYEISRYGTLKQWAQQLGMKDAVRLLDQTLQEEKKTDESLTSLAEASVNLAAAA
jgi:ferritin-like metal-binding protein YciE